MTGVMSLCFMSFLVTLRQPRTASGRFLRPYEAIVPDMREDQRE